MSMAFITMIYNESISIKYWLDHYRKQLPNAQLIILDHGSSPVFYCDEPNVSVIRLPRTNFDDRRRATMISELQNSLVNEYDMVGYSDADELIVSGADGLLEDALRTESDFSGAIVSIGINLWQRLSFDQPIDLSKPIAIQRKYGVIEKSMCKPFISKNKLKWIPGFHTSNAIPTAGVGYYMFHLKYFDKDIALQRLNLTKSLSWSDEAIQKGWGKHQRVEEEVLVKKFNNVDSLKFKDEDQFYESIENFREQLISGYVLDSKGNYRCDSILSTEPVTLPKDLLEKLA